MAVWDKVKFTREMAHSMAKQYRKTLQDNEEVALGIYYAHDHKGKGKFVIVSEEVYEVSGGIFQKESPVYLDEVFAQHTAESFREDSTLKRYEQAIYSGVNRVIKDAKKEEGEYATFVDYVRPFALQGKAIPKNKVGAVVTYKTVGQQAKTIYRGNLNKDTFASIVNWTVEELPSIVGTEDTNLHLKSRDELLAEIASGERNLQVATYGEGGFVILDLLYLE